jgi:hypothetical protein
VAGGDQLGDRGRGQADAIFVVLDFLGHADAHLRSPDVDLFWRAYRPGDDAFVAVAIAAHLRYANARRRRLAGPAA